MNLANLRYFLKVAEKQHMTQAANELYITQPALSRAIANLEQELGVKLFERDGKNIYLNENGMILQDAAKRIFQELDSLQQRFADTQQGISGSFCIGSSFPDREPSALQACLIKFMQKYPNVSIDLIQYPPRQMLKALREGHIDIAVTSMPMHCSDVIWHELFTERLGLLLAKDHPLAAHRRIQMEWLRHEHFFCTNANSDTQDLTLEFCRQAGFEPNIVFQGPCSELIGRLISQGRGVSFMGVQLFCENQRKSFNSFWGKNLTFRPVAEEYCQRSCGVAYSKRSYHSKAMRLFHDFFLESASKEQHQLYL